MIATNLEQVKEWFKSNSEPLTLQKDSVFTSVNSYDEAILFFYSAPERKSISNNIWIEIESNKWVLKSGILPDKIGILLTAKDMTEEFGYWRYAAYIVFNRDTDPPYWIENNISMFVLSENDESKRTKTAQLRAIDDTVTYFGKLSYTLNQLWKQM